MTFVKISKTQITPNQSKTQFVLHTKCHVRTPQMKKFTKYS